jgi:hypothetical protein
MNVTVKWLTFLLHLGKSFVQLWRPAIITEVSVVFLRLPRQILGQYLKLSSNYTAHCRFFPENLTDMQLVKKFVAL